MCIGLPMRLISVSAGTAVGERRGERRPVDVMLIDAPAEGMWVLVSQGSALRVLAETEAMQIEAALAALEAALAGGEGFDSYFSDLTGREPSLPPHLEKAA